MKVIKTPSPLFEGKHSRSKIKRTHNMCEDATNMKSFHFEFTVNGTKSSQDIKAVNMDAAKKLVQDQYNGKSVVFQSAKEVTQSNAQVTEAFEDVDDEMTFEAPARGVDFGIASTLSALIKDEWDAIEGYNSAIATFQELGMDDIISVLTHIQNEENKHVGELQTCLQSITQSADKIDVGAEEAKDEMASTELDDAPIDFPVDNAMGSPIGNPIDIEVTDFFDADDDVEGIRI